MHRSVGRTRDLSRTAVPGGHAFSILKGAFIAQAAVGFFRALASHGGIQPSEHPSPWPL